jgi:hypothetical protein
MSDERETRVIGRTTFTRETPEDHWTSHEPGLQYGVFCGECGSKEFYITFEPYKCVARCCACDNEAVVMFE